MRFVNRSVRIQDRVVHNPINEVVDHGGNRIDPAETVIEGTALLFVLRYGSPALGFFSQPAPALGHV
jgi:hypothetical protein